MRYPFVAALALGCVLGGAQSSSAQPLQKFALGGIASDLNDARFATVGGGVLFDLFGGWLSIGGQGDAFFSGGYIAGRGTPFVQANFTRRRTLRPFLAAGKSFGEIDGPMIGGGLDVRSPTRRLGFRGVLQTYRVDVHGFDCHLMGLTQDYCDANFHGGRAYTDYQPTIEFGVIWR